MLNRYARLRARSEELTQDALSTGYFRGYRTAVLHEWLVVLLTLAVVLPPFFLIADRLFLPANLFPRFVIYRLTFLVVALVELIYIQRAEPRHGFFLLGYVFALQAVLMVSLMTADLGGFASGHYVGVLLVLVATTCLLPWRAIHSLVLGFLATGLYVLVNLVFTPTTTPPAPTAVLVENLLFLAGGTLILTAVSFARFQILDRDFQLMVKLRVQNALVVDRDGEFEGVLEASSQGFLSFGPDGSVSPRNSRACTDLLGGSVSGRPIEEVLGLPLELRSTFAAAMALYGAGKTPAFEAFSFLQRPWSVGERKLELEFHGLPAQRVLLILTDVTSRLALQRTSVKRDHQRTRLFGILSERRLRPDSLVVPRAFYLRCEAFLNLSCPQSGLGKVLEKLRKRELSELFRPLAALAREVADQSGKRLAPVRLTGDSILVFPEEYTTLLKCLRGVIRRMVEQSIEEPASRAEHDKPFEGMLSITSRSHSGQYVVEISDDGRGVTWQDELLRLRAEVDRRKGQVRAGTTSGQGSWVTVTLPGGTE